MYNLLIALAIGAVTFGLATVVAGTWVAGFVPALLGVGVAYFLLARRTGKQFEAIMTQAMAHLQAQMPSAQHSPSAQRRVLDEAREIIKRGLPLGQWQFLVTAQIHAQLGGLYYMQREFHEARPHLEQAWSRDWRSKAMLAAVDYRQGHTDKALETLQKLTGPGAQDPSFWMIYAVIAHRSQKAETALLAISEGVRKNPASTSLKALADQLRNKRPLTPEIFGEAWLQFFPEDAQRVLSSNPELAARLGAVQQPPPPPSQAANGRMPGQPAPNRAQRRAAERTKGKKDKDDIDHPTY